MGYQPARRRRGADHRRRVRSGWQAAPCQWAIASPHRLPAARPPAAEHPAGARSDVLCPIRTEERNWRVLTLSGWAGQQLITSPTSLSIQAALLGATLDRDAVLSAMTEQQATLQASYTRERMRSTGNGRRTFWTALASART